jgi:hypothetical protein
MRRASADYTGTMGRRRSPILLLAALAALFALPAPASAQDANLPVNTTVPTPGTWQNSPYVVTLTGTDVEDPLVDMQWQLGPLGSISTVASGGQISVSDQGVLDFRTRALDDSGNASDWRSEELRIDTADPVDDTDPGAVAWHWTAVSVEVSATDATSGVDHVEWTLDGGSVQSGPNDSDVLVSGNGPHLLRTRAVDVAGNVSDWTDHTIRIDTVLPTDTTTAPPTGWLRAPVDFTVRGLDEHSGVAEVSWIIDGGAPDTDSPTGAFTISGDGEHTVQTLVRDVAGNESGWKSHPVKIDATAPTNLTAFDGAWTQTYAVDVEATDATSGLDRVEWQIDGGDWLHGPTGSEVVITGTGNHVLRTRARDVAGNVSVERIDNVRVDQTAPTNSTAAAPGAPVSDPYQVAVAGTDLDSGIASVEWEVDGTPHSGAPNAVATVSGNGPHTLRTRVIDAAGNASAWRTDTITIDGNLGDTLPPVDTTTTANAQWRPTPIAVTVSATDSPSGVAELQWQLDGEGIKSSDFDDPTFVIDEEGEHDLRTRARDNGDRWSDWREQTFRVDLTPPQDTTAISAGWQDSNTFTLSGTDAASGVDDIQYRINGGPVQHGINDQSVPVGPDGTYTISTRVFDEAGQATVWKHATLNVDTVDPVNTSDVPDTDWLDAPLELALSGTDLHFDTVQWRVDGGTITDGGPAVVDTDGEHTLETQAIDEAGNVSGWRTDTVKVDTTAPVNTTPQPAAGWRRTPYAVVVSGEDGAGSGVAEIARKVDGGAESDDENVTITGDGVHTLSSRIVDNVGHMSAWRDDVIKIDSVAPSAAISCNAGTGAWSPAAVSCSVSAAGGPSGLSALTLTRDGAGAAIANGSALEVGEGVHTLALAATDGAGNNGSAQATVYVDATAPLAALSCAVEGSKHSCRADASDATSGLASLAYSVDGGAYTTIAAGGTFALAKGKVTLRAVDVAGHETVTTPVTLTTPKGSGATVKVSSVPVYLAGQKDPDGLVGALNAARSENGTVSLDLRPLAVGRGRYRVEIAMKAGKRSKRFTRTYKVGSTGTLPRIAASLSKATARCTVTLTVRKKVGRRWRRHAATRLVLAK